MSAPFQVIPYEKSDLEGFLREYWNARLGDKPCPPITRIDGRPTIGEQIPNYEFSYNESVISRKSFKGFFNDPCDNENIITSSGSPLRIDKGEDVIIVIGSSLFTEYGLETPAPETPEQLVMQEMDTVKPGHLSVKMNGQQLVPRNNIDSLRVGPTPPFDLVVHQDNLVAEKMEYPLEKGKRYANSSTGGHCLVVRMEQPGEFNVRVDFDGVRSYSNRVEAALLVTDSMTAKT